MNRARGHAIPIKRIYLLMAFFGVVLVIIMFISSIVLTKQILQNRIIDNNRQLLSYGVHQIDQELRKVRETVLVLTANDDVLQQLSLKQSELNRYTLKVKAQGILQNEQSINDNLIGLCAYYADRDILLSAFAKGAPFPRRAALEQAMLDYYGSPDFENGQWYACEVQNESFLLCTFAYENRVISAWVHVDTFIHNCFISNLEQGYFFLMDGNDAPLYQQTEFEEEGFRISRELDGASVSGVQQDYLILTQSSGVSEFYLAAIYPYDVLLGNFSGLIRLLLIVSTVIGASLLMLAVTMSRIGYLPVRALVAGMEEIASGNLDYRIPVDSMILEYSVMSDTFNNMSRDLRTLQHDIYERRISEQKMNLQYLQLQIRPHFLYNILNIACTMIRMGRSDSAYNLLLSLIAYFRYILADCTTLVSLRRELEHIQIFLGIEDMRFPDRITAVFDVAPEAADCMIPPLIIFTLLENAVKHSLTDVDPLIIRLQVRVLHEGAQTNLHILLTDSGTGFSDEALEQINQPDEPLDNARNSQIGLKNVLLRLRLMYGDTAKIRFYNADHGGACNDIIIPAIKEDSH